MMEDNWYNKFPLVTGDDFVSFLYWLIKEEDYEADDIVYVVEKPWKYQDEYHRFLKRDEEE